MSLTRRSALQVLGAAAIPTLARAAGAPADWGAFAHELAASSPPSLFRVDERATVSAIADAILPRTDTPGALDVGVPAFIEFITAEWMTDDERTSFRAGIADLDAHALATHGRAWPALDAAAADTELDWAEDDAGDGASGASGAERTAGQRTFHRLKSYVLHGYFTSERVQREVFHTNITPGRYFGCNPLPASDGPDA